jgi:transposase
MNAPETALAGKDTGVVGPLYMALELSDKKWLLVLSDQARGPSRYTVDAGDKRAVLDAIAKAKARCGLVGDVVLHSCYEAGRDGFWLHRWLLEQGIDNIVVDSASIEVNRRARRAKTDRLDGGKLLTMLMRYLGGERRVWSVVRVPTPQEEDARRAHRELDQLRRERAAHTNRIGSLLVLHNHRVKHVGGRDWAKWWARHGSELPAALRAGIEREMARLVLLKAQIKTLEAQQCKEVATGLQPQVAQLSQVRGVGVGGAWILVKELFGWRRFHNRRQVAGCIGLAPTPYNSGDSQTEQGIAKAGNKRARRIMVELGWSWLRYQPESDLSKWFDQRFAHGGKRMRRIGIVALARRLAIALWRYLEHGEIPAGATLKPIPPVRLEPMTP